MSIEDIPADQDIIMTTLIHRAFSTGGCKPCCHGCGKWIEPNSIFKLTTCKTYVKADGTNQDLNRDIETREVMLCDKCTIESVENKASKGHQAYLKRRAEGGGCYRVNGKIVI